MQRFGFVAVPAAVVLLMVCSLVTPAAGLPLCMDYTGLTWSSSQGGGSLLQSVGVITAFDPETPTPGETFTYYLSSLVLQETEDLGGGVIRKTFGNGRIEIYQSTDPSNRPYNYGISPPDGAAPPSFVDGLYWLGGDLESFTLTVDSFRGRGTLVGTGEYTEGSYFSNLLDDRFFTFAGMTRTFRVCIPYGYEYRIDGRLTAEVQPVPEPASLILLAVGLTGAGLIRRRRAL